MNNVKVNVSYFLKIHLAKMAIFFISKSREHFQTALFWLILHEHS